MIVLDTQPLSQLQLGHSRGALRLLERLARVNLDEVAITIISPYEQLRTCIGDIHSHHARIEAQSIQYARLLRLVEFYAGWSSRILPFDDAAARVFGLFSAKLRREIGGRDARIAAIALAHQATVVTANVRHFQAVPGLRVEDWLGE